jgi:hypothetical protein
MPQFPLSTKEPETLGLPSNPGSTVAHCVTLGMSFSLPSLSVPFCETGLLTRVAHPLGSSVLARMPGSFQTSLKG